MANLVNIAQNHLLDALMLDNLAQNTSVATTNDQNLLWIGVRVHGQVCDHLLVCELITLGALDDIIENEDHSVVGRLKDQDVLILGLLVVDDLFDFESHGLARPHLGNLVEPAILVIGVSLFIIGKT